MRKQGSRMRKQVPKGTQEIKKVKPYLKLMPSVHLNSDYGVSVLGCPPIGHEGLVGRLNSQDHPLPLCSSIVIFVG